MAVGYTGNAFDFGIDYLNVSNGTYHLLWVCHMHASGRVPSVNIVKVSPKEMSTEPIKN